MILLIKDKFKKICQKTFVQKHVFEFIPLSES